MKCRYFTRQQRDLIKICAEKAAVEQLQDCSRRSQALWAAAMLNAGYSVEEIGRVIAELPSVTEKYGECQEDGIADFALFRELRAAGVPIDAPEVEL